MLFEDQFKTMCPVASTEITDYANAHFTTLHIENLFNGARALCSKNRRGGLGSTGLWHNNIYGTKVLPDFELTPVAVGGASRLASSSSAINDSLFNYTDESCSVDDNDLEHLGSEKPDWPALSPQGITDIGMKTELLLASQGKWDIVNVAFQSLLAQPGFLVAHKSGTPSTHLVVRCSPDGVLAFKVGLRTIKDSRCVLFRKSAFENGPVFFAIEDANDWRAARVEAILPSESADVAKASAALQLRMNPEKPLLTVAARNGFHGMTSFYMKKLFDFLEIPGRQSFISCFSILAERVLPPPPLR